MPAPSPIPVVVVSGVDPVLLDLATAFLLCDLPGGVAMRHEVRPDGSVRRVVGNLAAVVEDTVVPGRADCPGCGLPHDVVHDLQSLTQRHVGTGQPLEAVVVALPVGLPPTAVVRHLDEPATARRTGLRLAAVATVVDLDTAVADLLGTVRLADRDRQLCRDDARSVAHALAAQLHPADVVLTRGGSPTGRALVDQLRGPGSRRRDLLDTPAALLLGGVHDGALTALRTDVQRLTGPRQWEEQGIWTITLSSPRPLHPQRWQLVAHALQDAPVRSRGCFALPTRPGRACGWDAAGGQLLVRDLGDWRSVAPTTRLVFTGAQGEREVITDAFRQALLTDAELAEPAVRWSDVDDGLDPWLGVRSPAV